jgi:hypothetical protein
MALRTGNGDKGGSPTGDSGGIRRPPPPPPAFRPFYCVFGVDSFTITNTRARHNDTDHVTIGLKVGNKVFDPRTKHMGDVNNGTHPVALEFDPVSIDLPTTEVIFNFQIMNSGNHSNEDTEKKLSDGAITLLVQAFSLTTPWTAFVAVVWHFLSALIFVDSADGPEKIYGI